MEITLRDYRKLTAWPLLLLVSFLCAPRLRAAETADDYFHTGAQDYIFGEKKKALTDIVTGLQLYPTDPKLNGVIQLLKKKQQEQQKQQNQKKKNGEKSDDDQKQQDQQSSQQDKDKEKDKDQDKNQQQQSQQQKKDEEKARQDQAKKDEEQKKQQEQQQQASQSETNNGETNAEQAMAEAQMTPDEARQLLDQQKDDEKVLIFGAENKQNRTQSGPLKDW